MRYARSWLLTFLLAGCASAPATTEAKPEASAVAAARRDPSGLPPVRSALEFPAGASEVSLGWLVDELARLSGQEQTMAPSVRQQLDALHEPLEITAPVPADEVYAYVEGLLAMQSFLIAPIKAGERPMLGVYGGARAPQVGEMRPVRIEPDEVEALADHPALFCQVLLVFENVDSRQLQTQLRQMLVDSSGTRQCVPAGDRGLLLQAPGMQLLGLVSALREVDRASAARPRIAAEPAQSERAPQKPGPPPPSRGE